MDDLISRQTAIDALSTPHGILYPIRTVEELTPAQPERKKGRWFWTDGMYACDQCHEVLDEKSPFCPMCGADMRGEQDE